MVLSELNLPLLPPPDPLDTFLYQKHDYDQPRSGIGPPVTEGEVQGETREQSEDNKAKLSGHTIKLLLP
jgi:hypothetical protein